jgi:glycosyltransferase involved in cell wall biosynthesis
MAKVTLSQTGLMHSVPPDTWESARSLRIALVTETFLPRIDGTVTRLSHTVRHLSEAGHTVLVIAPEGGIREFGGARVHGVSGFPFPLYPELKLSLPRPSIGKVLKEFQPDLIHAAHPMCLGAAALYYSAMHRVPLVLSYHCQLPKWLKYYHLGFLEPLVWWGVRSAYNRADLTLATSSWMQAELLERGVRGVELWQRGVDTELFHEAHSSAEMRARLTQGHPEDKLLLYVGRLSAEKDIEECRPVLAALPGVRLALVGDGPHRRRLEQYFAGTPTCFTGFLKGAELSAAYASADVFLMPSRTETLGLVLLEAMAAGCPVVAAAAGGILNVVEDGVTGHLYDPGDTAAATAAVSQLLGDSGYRNAMRRRARLEVERWGWGAATRQLEGFYRTVLAREQELPQRITAHAASGATDQGICEALQISRATLRRLREARGVVGATKQ